MGGGVRLPYAGTRMVNQFGVGCRNPKVGRKLMRIDRGDPWSLRRGIMCS